jgi:hypothetical protein
VARRAGDDGYEAIEGENLAIFMDPLAPFSHVRILEEDGLRPGSPWSRIRKSNGLLHLLARSLYQIRPGRAM